MNHALYVGSVEHQRWIPKPHGFSYSLFMWFFDLDRLSEVPDLSPWFTPRGGKWAVNRFYRHDYLGDASLSLAEAVRQRMQELTDSQVTGKVFGLVHVRTLGLYFSPVNFYYGYDAEGKFSHFLAEVSNTPWNERYHYAYRVHSTHCSIKEEKRFKVSPFNPVTQNYQWQIEEPSEKLSVTIAVSDERGEVFKADLRLQRQELSKSTLLPLLLKKPVMTAFMVGGIYYQALKIYLKGIPYIPYHKEAL